MAAIACRWWLALFHYWENDVNNFYIYLDRAGKMPVLSRYKATISNRPYWIQYQNGRPVAYHGPETVMAQDISGKKIWDYRLSKFVPIADVQNCP